MMTFQKAVRRGTRVVLMFLIVRKKSNNNKSLSGTYNYTQLQNFICFDNVKIFAAQDFIF